MTKSEQETYQEIITANSETMMYEIGQLIEEINERKLKELKEFNRLNNCILAGMEYYD